MNWAIIQKIYNALLRNEGLSYFDDSKDGNNYTKQVKDFVDTVRNDNRRCFTEDAENE